MNIHKNARLTPIGRHVGGNLRPEYGVVVNYKNAWSIIDAPA